MTYCPSCDTAGDHTHPDDASLHRCEECGYTWDPMQVFED